MIPQAAPEGVYLSNKDKEKYDEYEIMRAAEKVFVNISYEMDNKTIQIYKKGVIDV